MPSCWWPKACSPRRPCGADAMRVLKFGGTSVADDDCYRAGGGHRRRPPGAPQAHLAGLVVVVSALGGVTDDLLDTASIARTGRGARREARVSALRDRHLRVLEGVAPGQGGADARGFIDAQFAQLAAMVGAVAVLHESLAAIARRYRRHRRDSEQAHRGGRLCARRSRGHRCRSRARSSSPTRASPRRAAHGRDRRAGPGEPAIAALRTAASS